MKSRVILFSAIVLAISTITAISMAQRTPEKGIAGDFKITFKNTTSGQTSQSTTMIKGLRERQESVTGAGGMTFNQVTLTQCDLRRTIQINDQARKYLVTPMDTDESGSTGETTTPAPTPGSARRGGLVTVVVNTIDTGERKEMFGFMARHLKRTTMMEAGPDACQQRNMKIETDGWYINLEYGLNCGNDRPAQINRMAAQTGCRDRYQYRRTGPTNLGFALQETTTMEGIGGQQSFTTTKEVVDISRDPLDAALFEVPAGYTQAQSQQEMYAAPSMAELMAMARQQSGQTNPSSGQNQTTQPTMQAPSAAAPAEKVKIGVADFNNKTKAQIPTDSLRDQLITVLNGNGIDAVPLNSSSASEAAIEAKAKGCSYILFTDVSSYKSPSTGKKIGGLLGRATGTPSGDSGKAEAKLDFRLLAADGTTAKLQSSASGKEDTADASVNAALQEEARAVAGAVGRN